MNVDVIINELAHLLEIEPTTLNINSPLEKYENWDSLAIISMIASIDENFGVLLQGSRIEKCKSVKDILDLINESSVKK